MKFRVVIGSVLLVAFFMGCGGTTADNATYAAVELGRWEADSTYYTLDGEPTLILGFQLPAGTVDTQAVTGVIERIHGAGGNYLGLSTRGVSDSTLRRWQNRANKFGVVLDSLSKDTSLVALSATVADFNLAVLAGSPGNALVSVTPAGLNAIRGIRIVERYLRFMDLEVDPNLLVGDRPPATLAARDSIGNYLIHIGGEGAVNVRFVDEAQVPRRVTVIGYLGTQRSEILLPPYGRTFTLISEEARGGWMLISPLKD